MLLCFRCGGCGIVTKTSAEQYGYSDDSMDVGSQRSNTISDHLRHAASKGNLDEIVRCLQAGATFDIDQDGRTALHYAALNGYTDVTKFLLEKGCEINVQDASGYTALHRAASQGHLEVITALVERGCDVNTQDEHGNAAIHEAAWNGFSKTLELLVKFDVNVSIVNKAGFTALHLSAQNGHNESSRVLLYAGCNSDIKNNYGDTTLHTAARYGHAGVTRILISARVKINEHNKNGDTALHIAAALKRRKIAKLLVESGSDITIRNKQNETAADVARRKDHGEIIVIIQAYSRPLKPPVKEVNFKAEVHHMEGPVVVPDMDILEKPDTKADRGKRFLFFKKKKQKEKTPQQTRGVIPQRHVPGHRCNVQTTPVQGFFSKYVPREGVQYYRDLAGNVKQGPVGYTPTCNCLPAIHRLEKQVHDTQDHVYGQLQSTNRVMQEQISQVDHRSTMRMQALEKYTQDRFVEEENMCRQRINEHYSEHENYYKQQDGHVKSQIQNWLEQRLEGYGHCLHHHHDDSALPNENIFSEVHETANGRLFKSRSDETLSQSDNHSGKFRKREFYESRQQAMQQIRAWQVPSYSKDRSRVKVMEKQRNREQARRSQSRQDLSREPEQRLYPVEPRIEIRARPQSQSVERNDNKMEDDTYMTMSGPQNNGAIPKHSALPQPQVYPNARKGSGTRGPMGHSTPKSRESSPYALHSGIVRSQTDGGINNKNMSSTLQQTFERKDISNDSKKQMSISERNLSDRSHVYPNPQQTFAYSNVLKPETGSVSVNSPYRNSTSSDNFVSSVPKPTFSTFGYEDDKENRNFSMTSPEQKTVDQTDQGHCDIPTSSTPRANPTSNQDERVNRTTLLTPDPFSRQNSQGSYGFTPRNNNDDMYVEMKHLTPRLHQRARSSEGLLETDIDHINLSRSQSEERTLDLRDSFYNPNTTRSSSATRDLQINNSHSPNSKLVSQQQQQSRISSPRQQLSFSNSSPHTHYGSSPYTVQSGTVRSATGPPTLPKPSVQSSSYPYSTVREVKRVTDLRYNGNASSVSNSVNGIVNGNVPENHYSTVRDIQAQNAGSRNNLPVSADVHNPSDNIYYSHTGLNNNNNQKQPHMEPRSKTAYQTYLTENPNFSNENVSREHSPNICNNSKEDSSSNPDSGYSSKIYGNRANSLTPASLGSTPSSSFSTDRGIHSNTNSPHSQYSNADYECLPNKQYEDEVQNHVQSWYQRKIQETTQKVYDNWRSERSPGKVTPQQQNGGQRLPPVRHYGNSDYAKIDYSAVNGRHTNVGPTPSYTPSGQNNHLVSTYVMHGSDV